MPHIIKLQGSFLIKINGGINMREIQQRGYEIIGVEEYLEKRKKLRHKEKKEEQETSP